MKKFYETGVSEAGFEHCRMQFKNGKGDFIAEITVSEHKNQIGDPMRQWVKEGKVDRFMPYVLYCSTEWVDERGHSKAWYNPMVRKDGKRPQFDFNWMLEATPENVEKLLAECERRYMADEK